MSRALSPPSTASRRPVRSRSFEAAAVVLVLVLHAWLGISATFEKTTAVDEVAHLTAGHALWANSDYRMQPENGVLPQLWEGLPAWLGGTPLPDRSNSGWSQPNVWTLGDAYFHQMGNDLDQLLLRGRSMNMLWSLGIGVFVFGWSSRLFGRLGAWVSLLFWAFCPSFLAHGALATSDMCMAFLMLASVGAYWRHLHDLTWRSGLVSAVVLALAFVAKYSAVLLPPMLAVLACVRLFSGRPFVRPGSFLPGRAAAFKFVVASAFAHGVIVAAVIWLVHGFRFAPVGDPGLIADYTRPWSVVLESLGGSLAAVLAFARNLHLLPDAYLYGFAFVADMSQERGAFLNGETSLTGWVHFFPYAFLVKTPLGLLLAGTAAALVVARRWRRAATSQLLKDAYGIAPLLVLFAVYWAFSLTSNLNIGHRHLLPVYPVLFIGLGALGWAAARRREWLGVAALLLALHVGASTAVRPHYLGFFNALAGGPSEGYRHLVDSSLDWGQDLPALADWLRSHGLPNASTPVHLAYFGTGDPEYHGIDAIPMVPLLRKPANRPWYRLNAGIYCVSATLLSQAYSPIRDRWSSALENEFQRFRAIEPALLDYAAHPERRPAWEKEFAADQWTAMWDRYEQLRFTRLCIFLRACTPEAQLGYSINVYRLGPAEVDAVTGDTRAWVGAVEAASAKPSRRN